MYWYYKVFFLGLIAAALYGVFSMIKPFLPDMPSFSTKEEVTTIETSTDSNEQPPATKVSNLTNGVDFNQRTTPIKTNNNSHLANVGLSTAHQATLNEAKELVSKHQRIDEAYEKAMSILEDKSLIPYSRGWFEVADFISDMNTKLFFSSAPSERKINHQVKSGDSLARISRNNTTVRGLQKGNGIALDSEVIHPGDVIRYFSGDWFIEVLKNEYLLIIYHNNRFFSYYKIGIGKEDRTPEGKFLIYGKVEDPIWEQKGKPPIPPGDPRNVLGSRWMKLKPIEGTVITGSGYGIHGTTEPDSVGTPASQGCIRMRNEDVEELFDMIPDAKIEVLIRN